MLQAHLAEIFSEGLMWPILDVVRFWWLTVLLSGKYENKFLYLFFWHLLARWQQRY